LRLNVSVENSSAGAFVLPPLPGDLAGGGDGYIGSLLPGNFHRPPLVVGVSVGMQEADRDGLDPFVSEMAHGVPHLLLVQWLQDLTLVAPALPPPPAELPWDERLGLLEVEVVQIRAVGPADLQHVPKSSRRDQSGTRSFALGQ